jgi:hypothetical protein
MLQLLISRQYRDINATAYAENIGILMPPKRAASVDTLVHPLLTITQFSIAKFQLG